MTAGTERQVREAIRPLFPESDVCGFVRGVSDPNRRPNDRRGGFPERTDDGRFGRREVRTPAWCFFKW